MENYVYNDVVTERNKYPDSLIDATACVAICNAVAWKNRNDGWGISGKDFGNYGVRFDGKKCAVDILHHKPSNHVFDVLANAADGELYIKGPSTPTWIDYGENTQENRPWVAPIEPQNVIHKCALGSSLFWTFRGYRDYRTRLANNLLWLKKYNYDYIRIFGKMGLHGDETSPWTPSLVMDQYDLTPTYIREVVDFVYNHGLKTAITVFADYQGIGLTTQDLIVKNFVEGCRDIQEKIHHWTVFNEPYLDGSGHGGEVESLRRHGRNLRLGLGGAAKIALGTPTAAHQGGNIIAELDLMLSGDAGGSNLIVIHVNRDSGIPPDLGHYNSWDRQSEEPRGPYASGVSINDAGILAEDYRKCIEAGYTGYVYHSNAGIWSNLINPRYKSDTQGAWENLYDMTNADKIAGALEQLRETGTVNIPPEKEHMAKNPYPDEWTYWKSVENDMAALYAEAGQNIPPEALMFGRWFARISWDLADSLSPEDSKKKHFEGLRKELGLPVA